MIRVMIGSIGAIALVLLLVNFAYLQGLGLSADRQKKSQRFRSYKP